jgi:hypothetical protein
MQAKMPASGDAKQKNCRRRKAADEALPLEKAAKTCWALGCFEPGESG